jgi:PAS domain S-box-containing protein
MNRDSQSELVQENAELRARLEEAEETLRAIRAGDVDALVIKEQVYTLKSAETPYRVLIEQMYEGAATLIDDGTVVYANRRLGVLLRTPLQEVIGASFRRFVVSSDLPRFDTLLADGRRCSAKGEICLKCSDDATVSVQLSLSVMEVEGHHSICVVVADLTERKRAEDALRQSKDQLEQRVLERTKELRDSNSELERFNRVMVGRELRMIELKKEVDELCRKAGLPPRYLFESNRTPPASTPSRPKAELADG